MFGSVDVVLISKDTVEHESLAAPRMLLCSLGCMSREGSLPDAHSRAWDTRQLDSPGETLVTLRIIIFEADLELDGFDLRLVRQRLECANSLHSTHESSSSFHSRSSPVDPGRWYALRL